MDAPTLCFDLTCRGCGAVLEFRGPGEGAVAGHVERARCWCSECEQGYVITVTMRAMQPREQEAELEEGVATMEIPLPHEEDDLELPPEDPEPTDAVPREGARRSRDRTPVALPEGMSHGTRGAYEIHRCRCDACTDEQTAAKRRWKARKTAEVDSIAV